MLEHAVTAHRATLSALARERLYISAKSSTKFVKKEDLATARKQLKNYERMKLLREKWIDLAMELSILRLAKKPTESRRELATVQHMTVFTNLHP